MNQRLLARLLLLVAVLIVLFGSVSGCGNGGSFSHSVVASASGTSTSSHVTVPVAPPVTSPAPVVSTPAASTGTQGCSVSTFTPNYATETDPASGLPNRLYHWNGFPAQVYFVAGDAMTPDRKAQILTGFGWWTQAMNQQVTFLETNARSAANIVVQAEERGQTGYGAITEYHVDGSGALLDATMTFNLTYLSTLDSWTAVAAHEGGHALGIGGHSNDHGDVMCSSAEAYNRTNVTARDINTLKTAYCGLLPVAAPGKAAAIHKGASRLVTIYCAFGQ